MVAQAQTIRGSAVRGTIKVFVSNVNAVPFQWGSPRETKFGRIIKMSKCAGRMGPEGIRLKGASGEQQKIVQSQERPLWPMRH